ncbi:MAG: rod shape-determining protein MreD [Candidatus Omnitrophota bacterium]
MKKLLFAGIILLLGVLQVTLVDSFKIFYVKPDFLLIIAVIASFIFDFKEALVLSVFAGVLKDILGTDVFGMHTLLFPLWTFLIERLNRQVPIDQDLIRLILIFVITFLHHMLRGLILVWLGQQIRSGIFLRILFVESLYTTLLFPMVNKFVQRGMAFNEQNKEC